MQFRFKTTSFILDLLAAGEMFAWIIEERGVGVKWKTFYTESSTQSCRQENGKRLINYFRWQIMSHHYQGRRDCNTVNTNQPEGLDVLIYRYGWINWIFVLFINFFNDDCKSGVSISFLIKLNDKIFNYGFITGWVGKGELAVYHGVPYQECLCAEHIALPYLPVVQQ